MNQMKPLAPLANTDAPRAFPRSQEALLVLKVWSSLSESEKSALLPELLVRTQAWHSIEKVGNTKAVNTWLTVLFSKAKLRYWE